LKTCLTKYEQILIKKSKNMKELAEVAMKVIKRMPEPVAMVSGPISTGGKGSIAANMREMRRAINALSRKSVKVFDQTIFEPQMKKIAELNQEYRINEIKLLEEFYLPLFKKKLVGLVCFMPDWQSSFGASWEHEQAKKFKLEIKYI